MAKLEDLIRSLRAEDLPPEYADLQPVLTSIDAAVTAIGNSFRNQITLADNVSCEKLELQLSHGVPQTVRLQKLPRAGSVIGYSCGEDGNGLAHAFAFPPEVKPTSTPGVASITGYFKNTSAVRVKCSIWIEPSGTVSSKAASDGVWIAPTFLNGWTNFGGSRMTAGYLKDAAGFVHLRGTIQTGTVTLAAWNLPAGYRPSLDSAFAAQSNGAFARVTVSSAGGVIPDIGSNLSMTLDGINFDTRS